MKLRIFAFLFAAVLLAQVTAAQSVDGKPIDYKPIVGVWRAQVNGLPAFNLAVTDEGGSLSGAILFYLQQRVDENQPFVATPGVVPAPILNPRFDGSTLTFQVSHRFAHPPRTLNDPPVKFALKLSPDGKAQFVNQSELGPIVITRSDY